MIENQIKFIELNIKAINEANFNLNDTEDGIALFGSITNLKTFLKGYFTTRLNERSFSDKLVKEFAEINFIKARIVEIANQHYITKSDLQSFYDDILQRKLITEISKDDFINNSLNFIQNSIPNSYHFGYTKTSLKKILEKQYDFIFSNGFPTNLLNINTGVMTANAGDSAQFLFLARAILAGYNCSNVDVRSSRYDAVVDFNNVLLRLQIKGVSSSNAISFKDRDRGGQGIDHTHITNKGKRITSADCDIYVAVDKEVGICYLIPMNYVDNLDESQITSINLNSLKQYKENWNIIAEVAETKKV
ncbi:hypothetical protein EYY60_01125 [Flavobacterium zhairuonense]|uniref:group I intron-associated PD-(D/E)XK endonuclease n=1 Tax=Flavobacterium zhairuonense TaxID=2493631 RepID=UPI0013C2D6A5|nr:group I intron-associated PD-(D/E)XK endonuclease [Flavobacterium zhairuonense]KAF2516807.1 hypothetical protein EYY60_01125 [Flavobacterium zhairuonense]